MRGVLAALALLSGACGGGDEVEAPPRQPLPSAMEVRAELAGLPFDDFLARSFELLLQRSPMTVVELGLESHIDVGESFIDEVSDAFVRETQQVEEVVLDLAGEFDRDRLERGQRIAFDAYRWYLEDRVGGHRFSDLDYRITPSVNSIPVGTQLFFTDIHPIGSAADADRYVRRLDAVGWQMRQLRDVLIRLDGAGIVTPRLLIAWSRPGLRAIARSAPRSTPYYRALEAKLTGVDAGASARADLLERAEAAIAASIIPAYRALDDFLADQEPRAPQEIGAWQYAGGDAYYAYALRHHITTEVGAAELHQLGLDELDRIRGELDRRFAELGYPAGEPLADQIARLAVEGERVAAADVVVEYAAIIDDARGRLAGAFDVAPSADVVVTGVPSGGFYVGPSLDNSRPGAFFATVSDAGESRFGMRTLAYHEAVPGHHLQIGIARDLDLALFQRVVTFTGFAEGWALYAEWLAGDLGWYEGDAPGDIGRLQAEAFRAARLVVDTGIHDLGWSFDQAAEFFRASIGFDMSFSEGQIARYASWPGQATSYWMGRTKLLELRRAAEAALGEGFDLAAFHHAVLVYGSVPLDVLATNVEEDLLGAMAK